MFNTFTFKSLASLADRRHCRYRCCRTGPGQKKMQIPGHWERSEDGGFEWVGKKSKKLKGAEPVVRDHRNGADGGGVVVSNTPQDPIVRDHRKEPVVRDHRDEPIVRDHRKKIFGMPAAN